MYEVSDVVLNICMVLTTVWIVNKFLNIFLEREKNNILSIVIWILFSIFQFYIQYNAEGASVWITIINMLLVFVITLNNFNGNYKKKFFIVVLLYTIWSLVEMITFFGVNFLDIRIIEANIIGAVISKIVMIINNFVIFNFWKNGDKGYLPSELYFILFIVPLGSIYIAAETFFIMNYNNNRVSAMIIFCVLLAFNIVIFEMYSKLIQFFTFEQENTVYTQQLDIMSRNMEEQKKIMNEFHEEKHNLVNELIILKHNVEHDDRDMVLTNLKQIIHSCDTKENISNTGNDVIDAIINFKYTIAKEMKIDFSLKIFVPEEMPFSQCDIGIVVGNAIDNAIEATSKCKNTQKNIHIVMGAKKETFIMKIENPFEHSIKKDNNGNLLSTKADSIRHGYGLNSIKKVVEKYNGNILIDMEDNIFSLTVTMGFQ